MKFPLLLVFPDQEPLLLVSQGLRAAAEETFTGELVSYMDYDIHYRMVTFPEDAVAALRDHLAPRGLSLRRLGVEDRYLIRAFELMLRELYPTAEWSDVSELLQDLRRVKEEDEIALIRRSCELNDLAYEVARRESVAGRTEVEVYGLTHQALLREVGAFQFFSGDFATGVRSVKGGGPATNLALQNGDTFILDLWTTTHGYWSDTCRTFVVGGQPTSEQTRLHDVVMKATEAAEKLLRPGVKCSDVYRAAYEVLEAAGWAEHFFHHAGHGIGLHPHEAPFFIPASDQVLEPGMTCTLEPGAYLEGVGGVRSEDNYLITADGYEKLTNFPRGLV